MLDDKRGNKKKISPKSGKKGDNVSRYLHGAFFTQTYNI